MKRVARLLKEAEEEALVTKAQLCHPLCDCQNCTALEDRYIYMYIQLSC